jgi:hypothetical protein
MHPLRLQTGKAELERRELVSDGTKVHFSIQLLFGSNQVVLQ